MLALPRVSYLNIHQYLTFILIIYSLVVPEEDLQPTTPINQIELVTSYLKDLLVRRSQLSPNRGTISDHHNHLNLLSSPAHLLKINSREDWPMLINIRDTYQLLEQIKKIESLIGTSTHLHSNYQTRLMLIEISVTNFQNHSKVLVQFVHKVTIQDLLMIALIEILEFHFHKDLLLCQNKITYLVVQLVKPSFSTSIRSLTTKIV